MKRNSIVRLSCLVVAAVSLSGCQSFPLTSWMFKKAPPAERAQPVSFAQVASDALAEGAAHLRQGNISAAVSAYRIALYDRATAAEAANGLAVSYAKLGRMDLAERYFTAAMRADPDNPKFAANFLRLQTEISLAMKDKPQGPMVAAAPVDTALELAAAPEKQNVVERVSRGEVMIRTRQDLGNAPTSVRVATSEPAASVTPGKGAIAKVTNQRPEYPVRIVLGE